MNNVELRDPRSLLQIVRERYPHLSYEKAVRLVNKFLEDVEKGLQNPNAVPGLIEFDENGDPDKFIFWDFFKKN